MAVPAPGPDIILYHASSRDAAYQERLTYWERWRRAHPNQRRRFQTLWNWLVSIAPVSVLDSPDNPQKFVRWWMANTPSSSHPKWASDENYNFYSVFHPTVSGHRYKEGWYVDWQKVWWLLDIAAYREQISPTVAAVSGVSGIRGTIGAGISGAWWAQASGRTIVPADVYEAHTYDPNFELEAGYWNRTGQVLDIALNPQHQFHKLYVLQNFSYGAGHTFLPPPDDWRDWQWQCRYDFLLSGQVIWTTASRWAVGTDLNFHGICHSRFGDLVEPAATQTYINQPGMGGDALEVWEAAGSATRYQFLLRPAYVPAQSDHFRATVDCGRLNATLAGGYKLSVWIHSSAVPF